MTLILDGYNIVHSVPEFESALDQTLLIARQRLMEFCENILRQRGDIHQIYLVFDGADVVVDSCESSEKPLLVLFSEPGEDADDRIIELLDTLPPSQLITVVSRDNYVMNHARSRGAGVLSPDHFYDKYRGKAKKIVQNKKRSSLSRDDRENITREYKKMLGLDDEAG